MVSMTTSECLTDTDGYTERLEEEEEDGFFIENDGFINSQDDG